MIDPDTQDSPATVQHFLVLDRRITRLQHQVESLDLSLGVLVQRIASLERELDAHKMDYSAHQ